MQDNSNVRQADLLRNFVNFCVKKVHVVVEVIVLELPFPHYFIGYLASHVLHQF